MFGIQMGSCVPMAAVSFLCTGCVTPMMTAATVKTNNADVCTARLNNYLVLTNQRLLNETRLYTHLQLVCAHSDCHRGENYNPVLDESCEMNGEDRCVLKDWICDGHVDCDDGRDEVNCTEGTQIPL